MSGSECRAVCWEQEEGAVLGCHIPCSAGIGGDGQGLAE